MAQKQAKQSKQSKTEVTSFENSLNEDSECCLCITLCLGGWVLCGLIVGILVYVFLNKKASAE